MVEHSVAEATAVKRSLLFGLLALQMDLLEEWQFVDAWESLHSRPDKSAANWLEMRGWMNSAERQEIDRLVERKLVKHEGDLDLALSEFLDNRPFEVFARAVRESGKSGWDALDPIIRRVPFTTRLKNGVFRYVSTSQVLLLVLGLLGAAAVMMLMVAVVRNEDYPRYYGGPVPAPVASMAPAAPTGQTSEVAKLFAELVRRQDVIEFIKSDPSMEGNRKQRLLAEVDQFRQSGDDLNNRSWPLVARPHGSPEVYKRGLLLAEEAVRLSPNNWHITNTLGVAQYRVGEYKLALETLNKAERINLAQGQRHPADTFFLAMIHFRLNDKDTAKQLFELSQAMRSQRQDTKDSLYDAIEKEAKELLESDAPKP